MTQDTQTVFRREEKPTPRHMDINAYGPPRLILVESDSAKGHVNYREGWIDLADGCFMPARHYTDAEVNEARMADALEQLPGKMRDDVEEVLALGLKRKIKLGKIEKMARRHTLNMKRRAAFEARGNIIPLYIPAGAGDKEAKGAPSDTLPPRLIYGRHYPTGAKRRFDLCSNAVKEVCAAVG